MIALSLTLHEIAAAIGAAVPPGADPTMLISGAGSLAEAGAGQITFYEGSKHLRALRATLAGIVLVPQSFREALPAILWPVVDPAAAFEAILEKFAPHPPARLAGIHPTAVVHGSAHIDATATVEAHAVIEADVKIGARSVIGAQVFIGRQSWVGESCVLHPHTVIRDQTILGDRVVVHSNAVIGSDGFGFRFAEGRHYRMAHRGFVQLDDDVEVGACTTIDRARFGRTWIQAGTKIDNLVQIAHNVTVGMHCLIISQTGISGSARLGKYVTLAGQVGVVGHVEVGDQVVVAAKSGVSKDTPPRQQLLGMFGIPVKEARELIAHYHRLPKTAAKLKQLGEEVAELRAALAKLTPAANEKPRLPVSHPLKIEISASKRST